MPDKNNKRGSEVARAFGLLCTLGINIAVCIGICAFAGVKIDSYFNTKPAFSLAGVLIGILAAMVSVMKMVKRFIERK